MIIRANGIDVYYEKSGEGKPFVLLHGNGEDHTIFDALRAELSKHYCVYAPDTRCHGKSAQTKTIGYHDMMEDAAAFIMGLKLDKPILLGFSDGAVTGILLAIKYPELLSGIVACGANTHPLQLKMWFLIAVKFVCLFNKDPKIKMMLVEPDIKEEELASIRTPMLILAGTRDILPVSATLEIGAAIPSGEVKILKGESHDSYIKHYDRLLAAMAPFLERLRER